MPERKTLSASELTPGKKYSWGTNEPMLFVGLDRYGTPVFDTPNWGLLRMRSAKGFYPVVEKKTVWINAYYRGGKFNHFGSTRSTSEEEAGRKISEAAVLDGMSGVSIQVEIPESI